MDLLYLIKKEDSLSVPKSLIRAFGFDAALMVTTLITEYSRWEKEGKAKDGWVFPTAHDLEQNLLYSWQKQWSVLEKLEKNGILAIISKKRKWGKNSRITATRKIKINEDALKNVIFRNEE